MTLWIGGRNVEDLSASDWDGPVVKVASAGFQGASWRSLAAVFILAKAFLTCRRILKANPPDAVLAMGSYSSVGPVCAARSLGIPAVLHEANAIPGRAVSFLCPFASAVAISFALTRRHLRHPDIVMTGYPVREGLAGETFGEPLLPGVLTVLVMGGSQGAHRLNEVASSALCLLRKRGIPVQVVHLTGTRDEAMIREVYEREGIPHIVRGFLAEMGRAYASADLAITRSGAGACSEVAALGVPALLVPLPTSRRGHQLANAQSLSAAGAADLREERDLTPEWLADHIDGCRQNPERLRAMKEALRKFEARGASDRIAELVERTARKQAVPA